MIRPFTCICMFLAAGSGLYLYQTKHRAQMLDRTIAQTYKQIDQTKDRIGVLKGEWALLNEPERLQDLAQQHLALKTLAPTQFVALADLGNHLPAPLPPGTVTRPPEDAAAPVIAAATPAAIAALVSPPSVGTQVAAAKPAAPPAPARVVAVNETAPEKTIERPGERVSEKLAEKPAEKPATASFAALHPASRAATVVASALPSPHALPPPVPVPPAPTPHFLAPVMNVSAQEIPHALAPGTVGEAVARANRNRGATAMVTPANGTTQPTYTQPAYAQSPYGQSPYGQTPYAQSAYAPPSSMSAPVSALGSAGRVALPAPVPYAAAQAVR